tara:strand:- start:114 stop:710 length:597 start_codon:yes stop_codon:yes gene_type:complete
MKIIGLDFDNTLTNYDSLFYEIAIDLNLIPHDIEANKIIIRDYLRSINKEEAFTLLQGKVYGLRIAEADQAKGMYQALMELKGKGYKLKIVSHKTKYPIKGEKYDLHKGALEWLTKNKFFNKNGLDFKRGDVFFELNKEAKIKRIAKEKCDIYIDDLPEILNTINPNVERILYKSKGDLKKYEFKIMQSWTELIKILN